MLKPLDSNNEKEEYSLPYSDILTQEVLSQGASIKINGRGSSMFPFIQTGDKLVIEPKKPEELQIGDVIFYRRTKNFFIAHRLIRRKGNTLITKGDFMDYVDYPVRPDQVLGKVVSIERHGHNHSLDSFGNRLFFRFWARLSPQTRHIRLILRPFWRIARKIIR